MTFNSGCSESASINNFGCSQPPPAPLPDIPATAVLFAFEEGGLFGVSSVTTIDEALNEFNQYLTCFPQSVCDVAQAGDILYHDGTNFTLESFANLTESAINELLPTPGTFLINDNGVVAPRNFCNEVEECIESAIAVNGNILTLVNNNLVSRPLDDLIEAYIEDLLPNNGDILINTAGIVGASNLCGEVFSCLADNLGPGQITLGGAPGGIALLCDEVEECLGALLDNGDVLLGTTLGVQPTNLCTAVGACLDTLLDTNAGEFLYNAGAGLVATDFCGAVLACVDTGLLTGTNTYYGTDAAGNVGEINFCTSVAACINANPGLITGILDPGDTFLGGASGGVANFCQTVANCIATDPTIITRLLGPGEIFLGATIATLCDEVFACLNLDSAMAGDLWTYDSAGNQQFRTLTDHMNDIYPQTDCHMYLVFDATAGWVFRKGTTPLPSTVAPLLPILPPNFAMGTWEFSKESGCSELVCSPRQKDITIQVPGNFNSLQAAVDWLRAKTIDNVVINLTAADPGVITGYYNGRLIINGNGNSIGYVRSYSGTGTVEVNDAIIQGSSGNGVESFAGSTVIMTDVTIQGHAANGASVSDGSSLYLANFVGSLNNGGNGIDIGVGSTVTITNSSQSVFDDNGVNGIVVQRGASLFVLGSISASRNAIDGFIARSHASITIRDSILATQNGRFGLAGVTSSGIETASATITSNGSHGLFLEQSHLNYSVVLVSNLNGGSGVFIQDNGSLTTTTGALGTNENGGNGVYAGTSGIVRSVTAFHNNNTVCGIFLTDSASYQGLVTLNCNDNGLVGAWVNRGSNLNDYTQAGEYRRNGNAGIYVQDDSYAYVPTATASDNASHGMFSQDSSGIFATNGFAQNNGGYGFGVQNMSSLNRIGGTGGGNALGDLNVGLNVTAPDGSFMI